MTYDQIRSKIYLLTKTNVTSLPNATLNLFTQPAEDKVNALLMRCDSRWQVDDSNFTSTLNSATTAIVSGQQDYTISTAHLTIDRVRVKDSSGNWHILTPVDIKDLNNDGALAYFNGSGLPTEYDKVGNSIILGPIPNYSQVASLEITFTRGFLKFDYSTGAFTDSTGSVSSSPGWNLLFHDLVSLYAAYDYVIVNIPKLAGGYLAAIQSMEVKAEEFYGNRSHDERPRMTTSYEGNNGGNMSGRLNSSGNDSNR